MDGVCREKRGNDNHFFLNKEIWIEIYIVFNWRTHDLKMFGALKLKSQFVWLEKKTNTSVQARKKGECKKKKKTTKKQNKNIYIYICIMHEDETNWRLWPKDLSVGTLLQNMKMRKTDSTCICSVSEVTNCRGNLMKTGK